MQLRWSSQSVRISKLSALDMQEFGMKLEGVILSARKISDAPSLRVAGTRSKDPCEVALHDGARRSGFLTAIGVLRLLGRRGDLVAQDDKNKKANPERGARKEFPTRFFSRRGCAVEGPAFVRQRHDIREQQVPRLGTRSAALARDDKVNSCSRESAGSRSTICWPSLVWRAAPTPSLLW
jgi:hypothetical protein